MNILFCTDQKFTPPLAAVLSSLRQTALDTHVTVYWYALEVSDDYALKIKKTADSVGLELITKRVTPNFLPGSLPTNEKISLASYLRIFAINDLPNHIKRIIYIDVDVLILGSIFELWKINLHNKVCGAVADSIYLNLSHLHAKINKYFNAGMLLVDTELWAQEKIYEKLIKVLRNPTDLRFHDQDALNLVLDKNVFYLDKKWNLTPSRENMKRLRLLKIQLSFKNANGIIHFASRLKPWHYRHRHPMKKMWLSYIERTNFNDFKEIGFNRINFLAKMCPRPLRKYFKLT